MKTVFLQLAEYYTSLGARFKATRTGQFTKWEPAILGEKICKELSSFCRGLDEIPLTQRQSREIVNKLRVLGKLIEQLV